MKKTLFFLLLTGLSTSCYRNYNANRYYDESWYIAPDMKYVIQEKHVPRKFKKEINKTINSMSENDKNLFIDLEIKKLQP